LYGLTFATFRRGEGAEEEARFCLGGSLTWRKRKGFESDGHAELLRMGLWAPNTFDYSAGKPANFQNLLWALGPRALSFEPSGVEILKSTIGKLRGFAHRTSVPRPMIIVMHEEAPEEAVETTISWLVAAGYDVHRSSGQSRTTLGVVGPVNSDDMNVLREFEGVAKVVRVSEPFQKASRHFRQAATTIDGPWGTIGGARPWIAIEPIGLSSASEENGVEEALIAGSSDRRLAAGRPFDAAITRKRISPRSVGALACLSIDASPQSPNYPVLFVSRPASAGADGWIARAEKELQRSENRVALLEAGGEYPSGAKTLEVAAIARAKQRTHLPIVVDVPSVAEQARYCAPVASAAIGAGADGVILRAWVGRPGEIQRVPATLTWEAAVDLAERLRKMAQALRG
jgi:3-deoxy-7-phosphoheptulonate synthase